MDKFVIRTSKEDSLTSQVSDSTQETSSTNRSNQFSKKSRFESDNLIIDPGLRKRISEYDVNQREDIRRAYLQKGPCQPRTHNFPQRNIGGRMRRFNSDWFDIYGSWLEYSISKDAAFCLSCYLFKSDIGKQAGSEVFVTVGFTGWNKRERLDAHIGDCKSAHNKAFKRCQDLMKQDQHINFAFHKQSDELKREFLLRQGLAFRGHDESKDSSNRGNFIELLNFLANHNEIIKKVVVDRIQRNLKLTSPDIQKDIVNAAATETSNAIINDLGDDYFAILVDESRDVSGKEQMALVLRYVDEKGFIVERLLGIVHVTETTALSLKAAIENLLLKYGICLSRVRGQGYDGASNMRGEFNGLKSLIMKENPTAYYIHFAKNHGDIALFFNLASNIVNVVGASCKRRDIIRELQATKIAQALDSGQIQSGHGLNQETNLKRAGDTRWGSHYASIVNLINMYSTVVDVVEMIEEEGSISDKRAEASVLMDYLHSFEFVFSLHLMKNILGITNDLSILLQRKDQDIINAMKQVKVCKTRLQNMRNDGFESLLDEISLFCKTHDILIPNMDDNFEARGRPRRRAQKITNGHRFRVEIFNQVIDMQLQEMNSRFTEVNSNLLTCISCLSPDNSFSSFNKESLINLAKFYPSEFSNVEIVTLDMQLENYIVDMRLDKEFSKLKGIGDLARKLVETKRNIVYPLVYLLLKLALILPVATATVERAFSAMKYIKNRLRNRMGNEWLNDCMITYIEKDVFDTISNDAIMRRFQSMTNRRVHL
ncbi:hypothetical protein ACJIZ3_005879 [Penstemon smallii]|uniref:TTF-type domain-containing protein n=1 Tax=Penstemon smallii TaxID=265156 RepID=A0ABD3S6A6_9LAMI